MRYRRLLPLLIVALILTSLSSFYEQNYVVRVERCWLLNKSHCPIWFLGAGFPLPFLIDSLAIPGEAQLTLGKYDFRWAAFVADVLIYLTLGRLITPLIMLIYRALVRAIVRFAKWLDRLE
jgi:hypothetical protein